MFGVVSIRFPNLGLVFKDLPVSINIFGIEVAIYGLLIAIGAMLGMLLAFREAKRTGQNVDHYVDLALFGIFFAIIGTRLFYVIFEWDYYSKHLGEIFNLRNGGLAIYGGIIAGILTGIVVSKVHKLNFFQVADTACIGLLTGQIIGRWGNFFNREVFGGNSDGLFAMQINTDDGIADVVVPESVDFIEGTKFIQVQPTFLYESVWNLFILIMIMAFRKHKKFHGEMFAWYIGGYGIGRFFIEGIRTDQLLIHGTNIPISQVVSVIMVIIAVAICIYNRVRLARKPAVEEVAEEVVAEKVVTEEITTESKVE